MTQNEEPIYESVEDNVLPVIALYLGRITDFLAILAGEANPEATLEALRKHSQGEFYSGYPTMLSE